MSDRSIKAAIVLAAVLGAVLLSAGCAETIAIAQGERTEIGRRLTECGQAWEKEDQQRLQAINAANKFREDAQKAILSYSNSEDRALTVRVLNGAWGSLVAVDRAIKAWEAGSKKDLAPAIANAYAALQKVVEVLTKQGVKIPGVQ